MAKNNKRLGDMRLSTEMDNLLSEVADSLGLRKTELARMLLLKSLKNLKYDIKKAGDVSKLDFEIKGM